MKIGDRVIYQKRIFVIQDLWFDGQEMRALIVNRRNQLYSVKAENIRLAE